jgi:hypothetical protein
MKKSEPSFNIRLEENLIVVQTVGAPSAKLMQAIRDETTEALKRKNAPQDILVTTAGLGTIGPQAIRIAVKSAQEIPYRRVAICGDQPSRIAPVQHIIKLSAVGEKVKIFRNVEYARAWLEEEAQPIRAKLKQQASRLRPLNKNSIGNLILGVVLITPY